MKNEGKKRELLFSVGKKDLEISFFNGSGAGGQHRNKVANSVHLKHPESGVMVTAQRERSRNQNLCQAFKQLTEHPKFKVWHRKKCAEMMLTREEKEQEKRKTEEWIDNMMNENNMKVEVKDENGKWVEGELQDECEGEIEGSSGSIA